MPVRGKGGDNVNLVHMTPVPGQRTPFEKLQALARGLLVVYIPGVLFAGMVAFGAFGYGLAHASGSAGIIFLAVFGLGLALAVGLPLLLLLPSLSPGMKVLKSLGMLALAAGLCLVAKAVWYATLEPALMTMRFQNAMDELSLGTVTEQPLLIDGKVVGLRLGIDVRLNKELKADPQGYRAMEFMQKPYLGLARANGGSSDVGLRARGLASVTLNGTALESLPGWAGAGRDGGGLAKDAMLPAGVYHVTQDLLLAGLDRDAASVPCLMEKTVRDLTLKQLVANSGKDIIATLGVRMALRDRLGYRHFERQTAPLKFRYDAAQWEKDLPQLPVESCSVLEERRALAEKAAARARAEVRYAASDLTLPDRDNPLYEDMCADDLEPLRRRLAAGTPPYLLSGKLEECGIRRPRPELFALVMPVLHARASQSAEYCDVVRALHGSRSIPLLEQLEAMGLPLYCEGERRSDWRGGIQPFDANGSPVLDPPAEDTLRWLQLLVRADVPVCDPVPGKGSLLNRFSAVGSPPLIELLLKAGCDPRFKPAVRSSWGSAHPVPFSPQVMWAIRRFIHKPYENLVLPVEAARFTTLNRLMGEPGAAELNAPDPETGRAFLHDYTGIVIDNPELLVFLVSRGLRLDAAAHAAADAPARSWYAPGYRASDNGNLVEKPMLDRLTPEQLRQLITPRDLREGSPGVPMNEADNFSEAGLGRYLCGRGVIPCR